MVNVYRALHFIRVSVFAFHGMETNIIEAARVILYDSIFYVYLSSHFPVSPLNLLQTHTSNLYSSQYIASTFELSFIGMSHSETNHVIGL